MCLYCLCCTDVLTMRPPPNTSAFIFNYYDTHFSTMERRYPTIVLTHGLETKKNRSFHNREGVGSSEDEASRCQQTLRRITGGRKRNEVPRRVCGVPRVHEMHMSVRPLASAIWQGVLSTLGLGHGNGKCRC